MALTATQTAMNTLYGQVKTAIAAVPAGSVHAQSILAKCLGLMQSYDTGGTVVKSPGAEKGNE